MPTYPGQWHPRSRYATPSLWSFRIVVSLLFCLMTQKLADALPVNSIEFKNMRNEGPYSEENTSDTPKPRQAEYEFQWMENRQGNDNLAKMKLRQRRDVYDQLLFEIEARYLQDLVTHSNHVKAKKSRKVRSIGDQLLAEYERIWLEDKLRNVKSKQKSRTRRSLIDQFLFEIERDWLEAKYGDNKARAPSLGNRSSDGINYRQRRDVPWMPASSGLPSQAASRELPPQPASNGAPSTEAASMGTSAQTAQRKALADQRLADLLTHFRAIKAAVTDAQADPARSDRQGMNQNQRQAVFFKILEDWFNSEE